MTEKILCLIISENGEMGQRVYSEAGKSYTLEQMAELITEQTTYKGIVKDGCVSWESSTEGVSAVKEGWSREQ